MTALSITQSTRSYEAWLRRQLGQDLVVGDLRAKHAKMTEGVFPFLRATYWRWAESILEVCPELQGAPAVLAVGDIHLENFGTWRDVEGRLIWGVNDFDEAAEMPYLLDLVRLAVSTVLGRPGAETEEDLCAQILKGYRRGLADPHAIVLDRDYLWLRNLVEVSEKERAGFWQKMEALTPVKTPPRPYLRALTAAMPDSRFALEKCARRRAGAGSLGRPRWVAIVRWRGGPLVREAKAIVPSAWVRAAGSEGRMFRSDEIASGRHRSPDPWYALSGNIVVRRLSPNNRKLEAPATPARLASRKMLRVMGRDLAAIHLGIGNRRPAIERDLATRRPRWLVSAVERAVAFVRSDYKAWMKQAARP
jgi:uncharacterized protein (DUF2252 family)